MFSLRSLGTYTTTILFLLKSATAFGAIKSLEYSLQAQSQRGYLNSQKPEQTESVKSSDQNLSLLIKSLDMLTISPSLKFSKKDYSQTVITERNGQTRSLRDDFNGDEFSGGVSTSVSLQRSDISAALSSDLSKSPYSTQTYTGAYSYRGEYDLYKLGFAGSYAHISQPTSYYVDRNFTTRERPSYLEAVRYSAWLENVLTENLKNRITIIYGHRKQDRPNHYGFESRIAYSINSLLSTRFSVGAQKEESTALLNERGRFESKNIDLELIWSPTYRFQSSLGYGLLIENEAEKSDGSSERIGHDIYSASLSYRLYEVRPSASISYRSTNTNLHETNIGVTVKWEM